MWLSPFHLKVLFTAWTTSWMSPGSTRHPSVPHRHEDTHASGRRHALVNEVANGLLDFSVDPPVSVPRDVDRGLFHSGGSLGLCVGGWLHDTDGAIRELLNQAAITRDYVRKTQTTILFLRQSHAASHGAADLVRFAKGLRREVFGLHLGPAITPHAT